MSDRKLVGIEIGQIDDAVSFIIKFEPVLGQDDTLTLPIQPAQAAMLGGLMLANAGGLLAPKSTFEKRLSLPTRGPLV